MLPPPIRAHLLGGAIQPEHRLITVAFVQFSGTDALLTSEGPGALAEALDDVVRNVQHACADHDITFFESDINRDGGKIMLTAGAPRSADHDEERMLRVARKVLDRAGRLPLRIGINRGHVFAGDFGPSFRRTFSVKGDAINLAARVMGKALPGQVLATPEVVARSHTLFRTTELPAFLVKGKSLPVRAVEVGPLLGTRQGARATLPLVGRDERDGRAGAVADRRARGPGTAGRRRGSRRDRQVPAGLRAAVGGRRRPGGGRRLRAVRVRRRRTPSSAGCSATILEVPPAADDAVVADVLTAHVSANAPHLVPWLPLIGLALDLELPATRETRDLGEEFLVARLGEVVVELLGVDARAPDRDPRRGRPRHGRVLGDSS